MAPGTESENPQGRSASGPTISLWNLFVHYLTKYLVVELVVVIIALLYFCLVVILVLFSIALVDEPHTGLPGLFIIAVIAGVTIAAVIRLGADSIRIAKKTWSSGASR